MSSRHSVKTEVRLFRPESKSITSSAEQDVSRGQLELYRTILRNLPVGVVVLQLTDRDDIRRFRILDLNEAAAEFAGATIESLREKPLSGFPRLLKAGLSNHIAGVLTSDKPADLGEISIVDEGVGQRVFSLKGFPISSDCAGVAFQDVTNRRTMEQAIVDSDRSFRLVVESLEKYGIFHLDADGHIMSWNAGAERLARYRADEIIGKHFSILYPPEAVQAGKPTERLRLVADKGQSEDNEWRVRKDGTRFRANVVTTALRDPTGNLTGFVIVVRDMTEQQQTMEDLSQEIEVLKSRARQWAVDLMMVNDELRAEVAERRCAEEQLSTSRDQLRALAARLQDSREDERIRIAREIHDHLGQACAALKMDLAFAVRRTSVKQSKIREKLDSAVRLVDDVIHSTRRIASELWPKVLEDLGLAAALEWQAQEFEARTEIKCHIAVPDDPLALDMDASTAIFRIFQESLTNVARHSQATKVVARLWRDGEFLVFTVRDNGQGFDPGQVKNRRSLGLVGMKERVHLLHGKFTVDGSPGKGTTIAVRVPFFQPTHKESTID